MNKLIRLILLAVLCGIIALLLKATPGSTYIINVALNLAIGLATIIISIALLVFVLVLGATIVGFICSLALSSIDAKFGIHSCNWMVCLLLAIIVGLIEINIVPIIIRPMFLNGLYGFFYNFTQYDPGAWTNFETPPLGWGVWAATTFVFGFYSKRLLNYFF